MTARLLQGTLFSIVLAVVFNGLVYWVGQSLGVGFLIQQPNSASPQLVTLGMIILVSIVTIVLGALFLWGISQFTHNPLTIFLWIAALVGLISLIAPYQAALGLGSFATLGLMHIITTGAAALGLALYFQHCENCSKN